MQSALSLLVDALNRGSVTVIDLTQPLGPDTPVIGLPPMFAASPGVTIDVISKYDDKGPAWYWNTLRFGEHTGTHFDAPVHWVTGKDLQQNACDTIPARRFVGPQQQQLRYQHNRSGHHQHRHDVLGRTI